MLERVMMIAGEASGDLHGARVIRELKRLRPSVEVYGIGGDHMRQEGMELLYHASSLSFMGFVEVVKHLSLIREVESRLEIVLVERPPDVLVLIDYPGFNLRFARKARRHDIRVLYYISPQVWAWHKGRVKKMRSLVDRMKVVFPFEAELYKKEGINVEFVGHPLAESLRSTMTREEFCESVGLAVGKRILGLFPGSRKQEIEKIFPTMIGASIELQKKHDVQVAVGVAPHLGAEELQRFVPAGSPVVLVENRTHELMRHADAAIVTSGTATLETGWFCTPLVVVYKTSPVSFFIGRMLVDISNIGLVNIVAGKTVAPEFLQGEMTVKNLVGAVGRILIDDAYRHTMKVELAQIRQKLGQAGASARVAQGIVELGEAA
ncbi:MAG TPA: lipid-A-disaccharide synthase [Bacteroidetes bacterium]|nr:lipid-A-disaccharide synthase [Bacteroidota bacterium]